MMLKTLKDVRVTLRRSELGSTGCLLVREAPPGQVKLRLEPSASLAMSARASQSVKRIR